MFEAVFQPFRHEVHPLAACFEKSHAQLWKLIEYPGNYERFIELRTERMEKMAADYEQQQEFIDKTFEKEVMQLPEPLREPARTARKTPDAKRSAEQKRLMQEHPSLNVSAGSLYLYDAKAAAELKTMADAAAAVRRKKPAEEFVCGKGASAECLFTLHHYSSRLASNVSDVE